MADMHEQIIIEMTTQGVDTVEVLNRAIAETGAQLDVVAKKFLDADEDAGPLVEKFARLTAALEKFKALLEAEAEVADEARKADIEAMGDRARARAQFERQVEQAIEDTKKEELEALGDRARAHARFEAEVERAIEEAKVSEIEALGMRARAHAQFERQVEQGIEDTKRADIEALGERARARAQFERQVEQAIKDTRQAEGDAMRARIDAYTRAEQSTQKWADSMTKLKASGEEGQKAGQAVARGVLEASRALEDFAVAGPLGALNNIPGIIQNISQALNLSKTAIAGVTAAFSVAATAVYLLYQNWDSVEKLLQKSLPGKPLGDLKDLQEALKALTDKEWKTAIDYSDIDILKKKIDDASAAQATLNKLRTGKTDEEQERAKAVSKAIVDAGGAGGKIEEAVRPFFAVRASEETQKLLAEKANAQFWGMGISYDLLDKIKLSQAADEKTRDADVGRLIAQAAEGSEPHRGKLAELIARSPKKFEAYGIDAAKLGQSLGEASPKAVAERKRIDEEYEAAIAATDLSIGHVKNFFDDVDVRKKKEIARVGPGEDDRLQKVLYDAITGGATAEGAMAGERGGLVARLQGRGVDEGIVGKVADAILKKASAVAENLIAEGQKPRLDVKADRLAHAERAIADELDAHHDKLRETLVKAEVGRVGPGIEPALEFTARGHLARGMGADASAARLGPQVVADLGQKGVPANVVDEVARRILAKAMDKASNQVSREMLERGGTAASAASRLQAEARQKFAAGEIADVRRAEAPARFARQQQREQEREQAAPGKRRKAQEREYQAHLKTLSLMEGSTAQSAAAIGELAQIKARQARVEAMIRLQGGNAGKSTVRAPTNLNRGSN